MKITDSSVVQSSNTAKNEDTKQQTEGQDLPPESEPQTEDRQERSEDTSAFAAVDGDTNQDSIRIEPSQPHPEMENGPDVGEVRAAAGTPTTSNLPENGMPAPCPSKLECDYDLNPTVLYQAIEAKQWQYAVGFMKKDPSILDGQPESALPSQSEEAATWVVRKETNGKLRWRLLPLHAAVIFGAPLALIELLLLEYPYSAQCKDDQGMLPLHLAFRNESLWDVTEEVLTAYPQALFVKDRKGRTPLQCGTVATSRSVPSAASMQVGASHTGIASQGSVISHATSMEDGSLDPNHARHLLKQQHHQSFKSVVSVMELYTQICISEERQRAVGESRNTLESRIGQLQDAHLNTLTSLKREWQSQREESKSKVTTLQEENKKLKEKCREFETQHSVRKAAQKELTEKLSQTTAALAIANSKTAGVSNQRLEHYQKQNETLRAMLRDLVAQQKGYHVHFDELMTKYDKLMEERKKIMGVFGQQISLATEKESGVVKNFKKWLSEKEKNLDAHTTTLEEEKKVDDVMEFVGRTVASTSATMAAVASTTAAMAAGTSSLQSSPRKAPVVTTAATAEDIKAALSLPPSDAVAPVSPTKKPLSINTEPQDVAKSGISTSTIASPKGGIIDLSNVASPTESTA